MWRLARSEIAHRPFFTGDTESSRLNDSSFKSGEYRPSLLQTKIRGNAITRGIDHVERRGRSRRTSSRRCRISSTSANSMAKVWPRSERRSRARPERAFWRSCRRASTKNGSDCLQRVQPSGPSPDARRPEFDGLRQHRRASLKATVTPCQRFARWGNFDVDSEAVLHGQRAACLPPVSSQRLKSCDVISGEHGHAGGTRGRPYPKLCRFDPARRRSLHRQSS